MKPLYVSVQISKYVFIVLSALTSYSFFCEWSSSIFGSLQYALYISVSVAIFLSLGSDLLCASVLDFGVKVATKTETVKGGVFTRYGLYLLLAGLFFMGAYISTTSTIQGSIDIATDIQPPTLLARDTSNIKAPSTDILTTVSGITNRVVNTKSAQERRLEAIGNEWANRQLSYIQDRKQKKAENLTKGIVEAYAKERSTSASIYAQRAKVDSVAQSVNAGVLALYKSKLDRRASFGFIGGWLFQVLGYFLQVIQTWLKCSNTDIADPQTDSIRSSVKKIADAALGVVVSMLRLPEYLLLGLSYYLDKLSANFETKKEQMIAQKSNPKPDASAPAKNENSFSNLIETVKIAGFELPKRLESAAKNIAGRDNVSIKSYVMNFGRVSRSAVGYGDKKILVDFAAHLLRSDGSFLVTENKNGTYSIMQKKQLEND
jgi:hypothetical protein